MAEFHASHALGEARERAEQTERGEKVVPVLTAIVAVLAALATLFSNHSSVNGLQLRTQAGILMTRAADSYNYYQAKRVKVEINQSLLGSGLVKDPAAVRRMEQRAAAEDVQSRNVVLKKAQSFESSANDSLEQAERSMRSYENFEVSATLFEVAIVIMSITALMRGARPLLWVGAGAAFVGLAFFLGGMFMH